MTTSLLGIIGMYLSFRRITWFDLFLIHGSDISVQNFFLQVHKKANFHHNNIRKNQVEN